MLYRLGQWGRGVIQQSKMTKEDWPANHTCLEKTQLNNIWCMFSASWSHKGHRSTRRRAAHLCIERTPVWMGQTSGNQPICCLTPVMCSKPKEELTFFRRPGPSNQLTRFKRNWPDKQCFVGRLCWIVTWRTWETPTVLIRCIRLKLDFHN